MSRTYGYVTKILFKTEFQHKVNKKKGKTRILSNILRFSWQERKKKTLFKYYTEKDEKMVKIIIIRTGVYL